MSSRRGRNPENNKTIPTCFGKSRECCLHIFLLVVTTLGFSISMILTVYITQKSNKDDAIVILIVASCVLYLANFTSNLFHIYYSKPKHLFQVTTRNTENSNAIHQSIRSSAPSSFTRERFPVNANFTHISQPLRNTPPPPYDIQMTEMSRMLLPGNSEITDLTVRESQILEESRKLISRLYEEIKENDRQRAQSPKNEQSIQQMVPRPETPARQQKRIIPKVSHPNLIINLHETAVKSVHGHGFKPADFYSNQTTQQTTQQKGVAMSMPTQLDLQRVVIGSERCSSAPLQPLSRKQDSLQVARKRKLSTLQTTQKNKEQSTQLVIGNKNLKDNTYEPIEITSSSPSAFDSVEYHRINSPEQAFVYSAASEQPSTSSEPPAADRRKKFQNPNVKVRRTLSAPTSRKFHQLGQSPETVLEAIATCFDLTPDEWMVAWKLGNKGVSPTDRAKILGVDLHEDSSDDSN